jgi:SAM-dependent methyltransferase
MYAALVPRAIVHEYRCIDASIRRRGSSPTAPLGFKDHFSQVAAQYAAFRPTQPPALLDWVVSLAAARELAWDCGTGNGQVAVGLAEWFARVYATDASASQIAHATPNDRVQYAVAPAEASGLPAGCVDLITVSQALHWFDIDAFNREATRVLVPGGAIAVWTYQTPTVEPAVLGALFLRFARDTVGAYWPPERRLVEDGYRAVPFPFDEVAAPPFELRAEWTLAQLAGYLRTWSATMRYAAAHGADPVAAFEDEAAALLGGPDARCTVIWPYVVRAGHRPG